SPENGMVPDAERRAATVLQNHPKKGTNAVVCALEDTGALLGRIDGKEEKVRLEDVERLPEVRKAGAFEGKVIRDVLNVLVLVVSHPRLNPCLFNLGRLPGAVVVL